MRSILVLALLSGTASAKPSWATPDEQSAIALELAHGWGNVDNYAFNGRLEHETSSELVDSAYGGVISVGKLGAATALSAGVTGGVGIGGLPMLAVRLEAGYGFDHDAFARGSIGVRYKYLEAGYARQESLGDRMGWLAPNQFYVAFAAPFELETPKR